MLISRKVTSRRIVQWLIVGVVLCIAMPASIGMAQTPTPTPTPTPATYQITYEAAQGTHDKVCPIPVELTDVHKGDKVVFYNASRVTITITPDPANAFDGTSTGPITLHPGQRDEPRTVSQGLDVPKNGIFVKLPVVPSDSNCPPGTRGPGMQVN